MHIGGDYTLTDQNGRTLQAADMHGKLQLVFFGFTNCPDICPLSLATISEVVEKLGPQGAQVQPIFISVDPERDTQEKLKEYASNFTPSLLALTGTQEQIDQAASAFRVYHAKGERQADGSYSVDHSGFIYAMDRSGNYIAHFRHDDPAARILDALKPYLQ